MNKQRRKQLADLEEELRALHHKLDDIMEEEQEYLDAMPQSMQDGDKGDSVREGIETMEQAHSSMDEAIDALSEWAR